MPSVPTSREVEGGIATIDYASLAPLVASALGDPSYATWTLVQIKEWLLEAIQNYSTHFARTLSTAITTAAGIQLYELPTDTWWVHRVEHPTGQTPPAYLEHFDHNRGDFTDREDRYDWSLITPQTEAHLWISRIPAAGEYIDVLYSGYYWMPSGGSYTFKLREAHYPLLILYAVWRAYHERWTHALMEELSVLIPAPTPVKYGDPSTIFQADPESYHIRPDRAARWHEATELARATYDNAIATAKAQIGKSEAVRWEMSKVDVIY